MKFSLLPFALAISFSAFAGLSASAQTFSEIHTSAGINHTHNVGDRHFGGGVVVFDYDNDGWEDLFMTGGVNPDRLYRNNGDGTFEDKLIESGLGSMDPYHTMGGAAADIDNDGDRDLLILVRGWDNDLAGPYAPNRLMLNNGDGTFSDITQSAGLESDAGFSVSASFGDFNLDGFLDIYVGNYLYYGFADVYGAPSNAPDTLFRGKPNYLYLNNGDNTFTELASVFGMNDHGTALATTFTDFDNDADPDVWLANDFGWFYPNTLFRNEYPLLQFSEVGASANVNVQINAMGVAAGDYDEDGDLDYYISDMLDNVLHRNNGNGTFTDVSFSSGTHDTYLFDPDGPYNCLEYTAMPGFVGIDTMQLNMCDSAGNCQPVVILMYVGSQAPFNMGSNSDTLRFAVETDGSTVQCANVYDQFGEPVTISLINNPYGSISYTNGQNVGSIGWGCFFFDYDNDTYLDLFVSNGVLTPFGNDETSNPNSLYYNNGDGTFTNIAHDVGVDNKFMGRGAARADFDKDGCVDIVQVVLDYPSSFNIPGVNTALFKNSPSGNNWLQVNLQGVESNRDGIGAHVIVKAGGRSFIREIDGGSSIHSQNSIIAHFGLAQMTKVDTVIVVWPGGNTQYVTDINANQRITIVETVNTSTSNLIEMNDKWSVFPNPVDEMIGINLELAHSGQTSIRLLDLNGKVLETLFNEKLPSGNYPLKFSIGNLSAGVYMVELISAGGASYERLVKE